MRARAASAVGLVLALVATSCSWGDDDVAAAIQAVVDDYDAPAGWVAIPPASNALAGHPRVHGAVLCRDASCLTGSLPHRERTAADIDVVALASSLDSIEDLGPVDPPADCVPTNLDDQPCAWVARVGEELVLELSLLTSVSGPRPNELADLHLRVVHRSNDLYDLGTRAYRP